MKDNNDYEQNLSNNPMADWKRYFDAINLFREFMERVKTKTVKNDGSDELLSIIDKYVCDKDNNKFKTSIPKGQKLYRARLVDPRDLNANKGIGFSGDNIMGFNETESREPPLGEGCPGRNNIEGASFLYVADKEATACAEVKPGIRQIISLAEFETIEDMSIIDFHSKKRFDKDADKVNLNRLFTHIMGIYCLPVSNDADYYASQYLSDYIRKSGIDGISYSSYYDEGGINYTIFNSDRRRIKFCGSRLMLLQSERKCFLDINANEVICSKSVGGLTADDKNTAAIRRNIIINLVQNSK